MAYPAISPETEAIVLRELAPNAYRSGDLIKFHTTSDDGRMGEPIAYTTKTHNWRAKSTGTKGKGLPTLWSYAKGESTLVSAEKVKELACLAEATLAKGM